MPCDCSSFNGPLMKGAQRESERKIGQVEVWTGKEGERERSVPAHQVRQRGSERQAGSALC